MIIYTMLAMIIVFFTAAQLAKIGSFAARLWTTIAVILVFAAPSLCWLMQDPRGSDKFFLSVSLQVLVMAVGIAISQAAWIQKHWRVTAHWESPGLLALIGVVLCLPFLWHLIQTRDIIDPLMHTNKIVQAPLMLCYQIGFLLMIWLFCTSYEIT